MNVQTLRYYERRGLLPEPQRSLGGHREYGQDALRALRTIKAVQLLGVTLNEIAQLPDANFGRILAAYGGIFIAGSLAWGMAVDGFRPDRYDVIGAVICLLGVTVIMYA